MANLTDSTNLTGTITISKATGTKVTLDTDHKYLSKDIELTINAQTTSATVSGNVVSYGSGWISAGSTTVTDANLVAGNIKNGVTIFGVTGTMVAEALVISDTLDTNGGTIRTITTSTTPTMLQQKININPSTAAVTVTPDNGYDAMTSVQINGDEDLVAGNIKSGVNIFGVTGTYAGVDVPIFTINWDSNGDISSVTCTKTFSECQTLVRAHTLAAVAKNSRAGVTGYDYDPMTFYNYNNNDFFHENDNNSLMFMLQNAGSYTYAITYASNGTITTEEKVKTDLIVPTFRMRISNGTYSNFSCDQTFSECKDIYNYAAEIMVYEYYSDYGIWWPSSFFYANMTENESSYMTWQAINDSENIVNFELTYNSSGTITVNQNPVIPTRTSSDLTSSALTVTAPAGYYATAASKTLTDANLTAANIKSGVTIFGVTGSYVGSGGYVTQDENGYIILPSTGGNTIPTIPLNTQLVDFTKVVNGYVINDISGEPQAEEWGCCTDYIEIDSSMSFTYRANYWWAYAFYTSSKEWIRSIRVQLDSTQDSNNNNMGDGTISGSKIPSMARYIRITAAYNADDSDDVSLIRTA